jgi:hypothetical protein
MRTVRCIDDSTPPPPHFLPFGGLKKGEIYEVSGTNEATGGSNDGGVVYFLSGKPIINPSRPGMLCGWDAGRFEEIESRSESKQD